MRSDNSVSFTNLPNQKENKFLEWLKKLFKNIRFYILIFSLGLSFTIFFYFYLTVPVSNLLIVKLTEYYALAAISFLYLAVMATPVTKTFTMFPGRGIYLKARRAIGVSAFYFALLHASLAFFGQLGGFAGLGFLNSKYLLAISLSASALIILGLMATTSFDYMVEKLTFDRWKFLHRFVYLAALLIIIHALLLGSHFSNLSDTIPKITFAALSTLLLLEANRFDNFLQNKFVFWPRLGLGVLLVLILVVVYLIFLNWPNSNLVTFGIHSQHNLLGENPVFQTNLPPSLQGDKSKRFSVSFNHPQVEASKDAQLNFQVFDASNGNQVSLFNFVYTKVCHLIIVDNELFYFAHLHPTQDDSGFYITTQFPHPGRYHLYLDFQPIGAIEQQFAFALDIGQNVPTILANWPPDTNLVKNVGNYTIFLKYPQPLKASDLSNGNLSLTFTLESKNGQMVTNLKPYLASFGHLVIINEKTYDYLHVHPKSLAVPKVDENSGPNVSFVPLGLYAPIKPGIYRLFAQFNPDNSLILTDFTIKIE